MIADEVNVKKVVVDKNLAEDVALDLKLTPELIEEGKLRELMRAIQEVRKEMNFNPQDKAEMTFSGNEAAVAFVKKYAGELIKKTNLASAPSLDAGTSGTAVVAEDLHLTVRLEKV